MLFGGKNKNEDSEEVFMTVFSTGKRIIGFRKDGKYTLTVEVNSDKEVDAFCKKYKIKKSSIQIMDVRVL